MVTSRCYTRTLSKVVGASVPVKRILLLVVACLFAVQAHAQGGDTCATATTIPSLPYVDISSTATAVDDYYASCPFESSQTGGKDRVYKYTTGASIEYVDISICQAVTNFDSKLMVYEGTCTGTPHACRDDGCQSPAYTDPYNSFLTNLRLNPDTTYYIVVDGYSGSQSGNYQLNVKVGAGMGVFWDGFEPEEPLALGKRHDPAACALAPRVEAASGLIERPSIRGGGPPVERESAYTGLDEDRLR